MCVATVQLMPSANNYGGCGRRCGGYLKQYKLSNTIMCMAAPARAFQSQDHEGQKCPHVMFALCSKARCGIIQTSN